MAKGLAAQQAKSFFHEAILDADDTMAETTGECKQRMDIIGKSECGHGLATGGQGRTLSGSL